LSATANCEERYPQKYTLDFSWLLEVFTPPQIWPYLPVLVLCSLPRAAAMPSQQIRPGDAETLSGNWIFAAEYKEYDA
jgi:hypothetical protein